MLNNWNREKRISNENQQIKSTIIFSLWYRGCSIIKFVMKRQVFAIFLTGLLKWPIALLTDTNIEMTAAINAEQPRNPKHHFRP